MTELLKTIINNPKTQNYLQLRVVKFSKESFKTQSQKSQASVKQKTVFEETREILGETIDDMDQKVELKDITISYITHKDKIFL